MRFNPFVVILLSLSLLGELPFTAAVANTGQNDATVTFTVAAAVLTAATTCTITTNADLTAGVAAAAQAGNLATRTIGATVATATTAITTSTATTVKSLGRHCGPVGRCCQCRCANIPVSSSACAGHCPHQPSLRHRHIHNCKYWAEGYQGDIHSALAAGTACTITTNADMTSVKHISLATSDRWNGASATFLLNSSGCHILG